MKIVIDGELTRAILEFRKARDWEQFHSLRTLSTSIVIEAAELAELTQWTSDQDLDARSHEVRDRMQDEVADLFILLSYLVHDQKIDVDQAVRRKLKVNEAKYPVESFRGTSRKYNE